MMSLPNTFVYMMFHPVAYIVKLNIEMAMADLITKIARHQESGADPSYSGPSSHGQSHPNWDAGRIRSTEQGAAGRTSHSGWETLGPSRRGTEYKSHITASAHPRPDYGTKQRVQDSRIGGDIFDDSNESREVDFADMMRDDSNVIVKTVEVQVSNHDHASDSDSTKELKDRV